MNEQEYQEYSDKLRHLRDTFGTIFDQKTLSDAACNGYVILDGDNWARAYIPVYDPQNLLVFNRAEKISWVTLAQPQTEHKRFEVNIEEYCYAFASTYHITRKGHFFFENGKRVKLDSFQDRILDSMRIVCKNPIWAVNQVLRSLRIYINDSSVGMAASQTERLSISALESEMELRGYRVRFNILKRDVEVVAKSEKGRNMSKNDLVTKLYDDLAGNYKGVTMEHIWNYILFIARENQFNPVIDYLESLEWDGDSRFGALYELIGIENDTFSQGLVMRWMYQTCAMLFNSESDPYGAEGVLVFTGEQGNGKTSLFRRLALKDEWFKEGAGLNPENKDDIIQSTGYWITELGEVENTFKHDINALKNFITAPFDEYRRPYERSPERIPRITSFCATCNPEEFLADSTGNRRWYTVPFAKTVPYNQIEDFDAEQLWAEVYAVVKPMKGEERKRVFRLTTEQRDALNKHNAQYEKPLAGQIEVVDLLEKAKAAGDEYTWQYMTVTEWKDENPVLRSYSGQQLSMVLRRLGVEQIRKRVKGVSTAKRWALPSKIQLPIELRIVK